MKIILVFPFILYNSELQVRKFSLHLSIRDYSSKRHPLYGHEEERLKTGVKDLSYRIPELINFHFLLLSLPSSFLLLYFSTSQLLFNFMTECASIKKRNCDTIPQPVNTHKKELISKKPFPL